jgi:ABC-type nickel/cobalt efflux system permease component RcnA
MVGPVSREERLTASRRIKIGFIVLVGLSAGLITLQGEPSILVFALAVCVGLVVGAVAVWLAFPRGLGFRS